MITNDIFTKRQITICHKANPGNSLLKYLMLLVACTIITPAAAQEHEYFQEDKGFFNSLSIGASASTAGIGFDVVTPIGNYFELRTGINIMPNFSFTSKASTDIPYNDTEYSTDIKVKGALKRTSGEVLLNIYLSKRGGVFLCTGASFGGSRLLNINARTDHEELLALIRQGADVGVEIGKYHLPIDKNGNISGGLKVASFRPYLGFGFGRSVPKKRIGFSYEIGVQFQKAPKIYSNHGNISELPEEADDSFKDIMNILKVYPVIKYRLCGKIF